MRRIFSYMLQGLLVLLPIAATLYVVFYLLKTFDDVANDIIELMFQKRVPGVGLLMLMALLTLMGYLSSLLLVKPFFNSIDRLLERTPGLKIIYSGIKDLISAFASDKKKFDKPVLINLNHNPLVQRMGFITQKDLSEFGLKDKIAVYIPHSYNISGNLYVVDAKEVTPLNVSSSEALKFMVSGGISDMD